MLKALKALFANSLFDHSFLDGVREDSPRGLQLAAAALLIEIGKADYNADAAEQGAIVAAIRRCTGVSEDELNALLADAQRSSKQATSLYEFTSLINRDYSVEQKYALIVELWRIAAADGEIHKYEDHLIRKIADLIYVSHSEFIRAKLQVVNAVD